MRSGSGRSFSHVGLAIIFNLILPVTGTSQSAAPGGPAWATTLPRDSRTAAGGSFAPAVSGDGRWIVFTSFAENLVPNDMNRACDVLVYDTRQRSLRLLSVGASGTSSAGGNSHSPSIGKDGSMIVFESDAPDLVLGDTNGVADVFLFDGNRGEVSLLSKAADGTQGNGASTDPQLTPDGRFVLFKSLASTLGFTDTNDAPDVFLIDRVEGQLDLISATPAGNAGNLGSRPRALTADGRYVVFDTYAYDLHEVVRDGRTPFRVRDRLARTTVRPVGSNFVNNVIGGTNIVIPGPVLTNAAPFWAGTTPSVTPDGRWVAYMYMNQVYLWDETAQRSNLVSVALDGIGAGNRASKLPRLTANGRYVFFLSEATNLVTNLVSGSLQLYRRDLPNATTALVSFRPDGTAGGNLLAWSASDDGEVVAFETDDALYTSDDFNQASDVFVSFLADGTIEPISLAAAGLENRGAVSHTRLPPSPGLVGRSMAAPTQVLSADGQKLLFFGAGEVQVSSGEVGGWSMIVRDLPAGTNRIVTGRAVGIPPTRGVLGSAALSRDGSKILFTTTDTNMASGDTNRLGNVVVRELNSGKTTFVAVPIEGVTTHVGALFASCLSSNGERVAYAVEKLVEGVLSGTSYASLAICDLTSGAVQFVVPLSKSQLTGASSEPPTTVFSNPGFSNLTFTQNGRLLIFDTALSGLTTNAYPDLSRAMVRRHVLAHDSQTDRLEAVSVGTGGTTAIGGQRPSASSNGRFVAFEGNWGSTSASMLQVMIRDREQGRTVLASIGVDGQKANGHAWAPELSADGRFVAFLSTAGNLVANADTNGVEDVFIRDLELGTNWLVSANPNGQAGQGPSYDARLSSDGRYVAFVSKASNLVAGDTNEAADVFLRDLRAGTTLLLSAGPGGVVGDAASGNPVWSEDGRVLVFESFASNMAFGDRNRSLDVFVVRVRGGDADSDGLDDDWEAAFFGDLARDGTGDVDGDGASDWQEFASGTNPVNDTSVLRAMALTVVDGQGVRLLWLAAPGRKYRIQYKDDLGQAAWHEFAMEVSPSGSTGEYVDPTVASTAKRFYRVMVVR